MTSRRLRKSNIVALAVATSTGSGRLSREAVRVEAAWMRLT